MGVRARELWRVRARACVCVTEWAPNEEEAICREPSYLKCRRYEVA